MILDGWRTLDKALSSIFCINPNYYHVTDDEVRSVMTFISSTNVFNVLRNRCMNIIHVAASSMGCAFSSVTEEMLISKKCTSLRSAAPKACLISLQN